MKYCTYLTIPILMDICFCPFFLFCVCVYLKHVFVYVSMPRIGIPGSKGMCILCFDNYYQIVLLRGYANLISHQQ